MTVIWVGLGAAMGAVSRYALTGWVTRWWGNQFPWGTLLINLTGSFLLGLFTGLALPTSWQLLLGTGMMGGYTTFSTFSHELVMLADQRRWLAFENNLLVSVAGGLGCAGLGLWVGHLL